jgi:RNA polymerase sigma-70 factor, ECF subfamily
VNRTIRIVKSDQELIAECLRGQTHAFGDLVARHQNRLFHTLVGVLGSAEDARDATQDAFINAFLKLQTFGGRSAFYSWLFRIAINAAMSQKRKLGRATVSIDAARENSSFEPVSSRTDSQPGFSMETAERSAAVRAALAELPEEFRTVLVLKEMEDLKYEEIAEIIGCPIGTVRSRIHRARAELRSRLAGLLGESAEE